MSEMSSPQVPDPNKPNPGKIAPPAVPLLKPTQNLENLISIAVTDDGKYRIRTSPGTGEYGIHIVKKLWKQKFDTVVYPCSKGREVQFLKGNTNLGIHRNIKTVEIQKEKSPCGKTYLFFVKKITKEDGKDVNLPRLGKPKELTGVAAFMETSLPSFDLEEKKPIEKPKPAPPTPPKVQTVEKTNEVAPVATVEKKEPNAAIYPITVTAETENFLWKLVCGMAIRKQAHHFEEAMKKERKPGEPLEIRSGRELLVIAKVLKKDDERFIDNMKRNIGGLESFVEKFRPPAEEGTLGKFIQASVNPNNPHARDTADLLISVFTKISVNGGGLSQEGRLHTALRPFATELIKIFGEKKDETIVGVVSKYKSIGELMEGLGSNNKIVRLANISKVIDKAKEELRSRVKDPNNFAARGAEVAKLLRTAEGVARATFTDDKSYNEFVKEQKEVLRRAERTKGDYNHDATKAQSAKVDKLDGGAPGKGNGGKK